MAAVWGQSAPRPRSPQRGGALPRVDLSERIEWGGRVPGRFVWAAVHLDRAGGAHSQERGLVRGGGLHETGCPRHGRGREQEGEARWSAWSVRRQEILATGSSSR